MYAYILILNLVWLIVNAATTAAAFSVISTPVYGYVVQQTVGWFIHALLKSRVKCNAGMRKRARHGCRIHPLCLPVPGSRTS